MSESSFPNSLSFEPSPLSISARSYESKCIPESSSTARPSEIVRMRIPSGRAGCYLNTNKSFLSFTVTNTSTAVAVTTPETLANGNVDMYARNYAKLYLDGSAYSVIQTQEVYNSSNLLESIQNANVLYNMLVDMQTSMSSRLTGSSILGVGSTGLSSQAWNQYRGSTLFIAEEQRSDYSFNKIQNREWTGDSRGMYTGLNIFTDALTTGGIVSSGILQVPQVQEVDGDAITGGLQPFGSVIGPIAPPAIKYLADQEQTTLVAMQAGIYDRGASEMNGWISRLGPVIPYGMKAKFTLPLVSGVVGSLCCKLFPLHALNSDLMLHITLASANTAVCNNYIPTHWSINRGDGTLGTLPQGAPSGGSSSVKQSVERTTADGNGETLELASPAGSWKIDVNYRLEDIAYHANMVEISAQAQAMLDQATGGQYVIPSTSYRHFSHSLDHSQTNNEFPVPARFTSVKSLLGCMRPTASLHRADRFSLSTRVKNNMTRLQYRVGSLMVPQEPIRMENIDNEACFVNSGKAPEAFCHLLEAVGQSVSDRDLECSMNDHIYGANHDIDYLYGDVLSDWVKSVNTGQDPTVFDQVTGTATTLGQNDRRFYARMAAGSRAGFMFGVDLESFSNANCTGPLQSGTNTLGLNIMCRLWVDNLTTDDGSQITPATDIIATTVDHFVAHDIVLVVSGGTCSSRF
jgi:hypothetical protein